MILNACEGKSLPIYGDGANIRDWLHVEDHCSGIWTVLKKGTLGRLIASGAIPKRRTLKSWIRFAHCSTKGILGTLRTIN